MVHFLSVPYSSLSVQDAKFGSSTIRSKSNQFLAGMYLGAMGKSFTERLERVKKKIVIISAIVASYGFTLLFGAVYGEPVRLKLKAIIEFVVNTKSNDGLSRRTYPYYQDKLSFFEYHHAGQYEAVFVGDSLTDNGEWEDLAPEVNIADQGIQGDTTSGVLSRISRVCLNKAPSVFIMIGVNDLRQNMSVSEVYANYVKIVDSLTLCNKQVFIQSTIYSGKQSQSINEKIAELNKKLEALSNSRRDVSYIDVNAKLANEGYLKEKFTFDGLHLNGLGYQKWSDSVREYF